MRRTRAAVVAVVGIVLQAGFGCGSSNTKTDAGADIHTVGGAVGNTWRRDTGLMYTDGTMRPAMTWLMDFLGRP